MSGRGSLPRVLAVAGSVAAMLAAAPGGAADDRATFLIVHGAPGAPEYEARFSEAGRRFREACGKAGARCLTVGTAAAGADRAALEQSLAAEARRGAGELWVVLVGHGTFDGRTARFNLRGADVAAEELAGWLEPVTRPLVFVNAASASGPFLKALAGPGRVVLTATKSGSEQNATRFATHLAEAIADPAADLDKDGQTSILEAYLVASKRVEASFKEAGLLASEHALLDDNGDGRGTGAGFYRGVRPTKKPDDGSIPDGQRAHQLHLLPSDPERKLGPAVRRRRDELELELYKLREARPQLGDAAYYARLERLALELARLYAGR